MRGLGHSSNDSSSSVQESVDLEIICWCGRIVQTFFLFLLTNDEGPFADYLLKSILVLLQSIVYE